MAEATEAPTGGSILEDREGNLFGIAFDPVGNGNCGVEAIVVALIEDVGFVANELHSGDASRGGRQVRAREPPVHMAHQGLPRVKEAAGFGGDLLAYADHMEKDGMWWGQFEFVVAGIVLSIDVRMLFGVTWESTFGIKMQVEIELEADQIPLKFRIECDVCLHLALVNIVTRKFECFETANHWVVLKEASRARKVGGALFSRPQTHYTRGPQSQSYS